VLTDPADTAPYCEDWRRLYRGRTPAVLRPATVEEVAEAVRLCAERGVPLVPQGGNTSMVGGAAVSEAGDQIILSLSRMNRVRAIDPVDMTMEIEAGVTLKAAQEAAAAADCLLPLSISSEGSAQIGGVLATNAGGNNTVRYGNARDLVLGLEVVLPDGQVWNGLRRLHKDNTGYCLRQLFVGSEGTLGIITAAVLKLYPQPREVAVALCAIASPEAALELFNRFQQHDPRRSRPMSTCRGRGSSWCCAIYRALRCRWLGRRRITFWSSSRHRARAPNCAARSKNCLRRRWRRDLSRTPRSPRAAPNAPRCGDCARNIPRRRGWPAPRSRTTCRCGVEGPELIRRATEACERLVPGIRCVPFGHLGDGNIHFNLVQPEAGDPEAFLVRDHELMDAVTRSCGRSTAASRPSTASAS